MKSYIINGGRRLNGTISVSGSKNASLPILAATIIGDGVSKLYNVPNISDTANTIKILEYLGCKTKRRNGRVEVNSEFVNRTEIPANMMSKMRSSIIFAGALLGRFRKVKFSYPGGYEIY